MSRFWDFLQEQKLSETEKGDSKNKSSKNDTLETDIAEQREALEILYELLLQNKVITKQTLVDTVLKRHNKAQKKEDTEDKVVAHTEAGEIVKFDVGLKTKKESKAPEVKAEVKRIPEEDLDIERTRKTDPSENEDFEDALKKLKRNKVTEATEEDSKIKKAASDYQKGKAKENKNIDWDSLL